jgi:hypothetical protein
MNKLFNNLFEVSQDGMFIDFDSVLQTKVCVKCNKEVPLSEYGTCSGGNYLRTECKACNKILSKTVKNIKKSVVAPSKNYCCPICNKTEAEVAGKGGKKAGAWCCDHDHTTNEFRGWLCHQCNRLLGGAKDNVEILKAAISYLENHGTKKEEIHGVLAQLGEQ